MRSCDLSITLKNQQLILTPEKAVYWIEQAALIITDIHLGKSGHFRKNGIAVPQSVNDENLKVLDKLIQLFTPTQIICLGDLFHSHKNSEWATFSNWRNQNSSIEMHLAIGNHDEYSMHEFNGLLLNSSDQIIADPFLFTHFPVIDNELPLYPISGHVHPSVKLKGKGRQSVYAPCFYFGDNYGLLPAFGTFTGTHRISPTSKEVVAVIIDNQVLRV